MASESNTLELTIEVLRSSSVTTLENLDCLDNIQFFVQNFSLLKGGEILVWQAAFLGLALDYYKDLAGDHC